jgi:hypothetical protein
MFVFCFWPNYTPYLHATVKTQFAGAFRSVQAARSLGGQLSPRADLKSIRQFRRQKSRGPRFGIRFAPHLGRK